MRDALEESIRIAWAAMHAERLNRDVEIIQPHLPGHWAVASAVEVYVQREILRTLLAIRRGRVYAAGRSADE